MGRTEIQTLLEHKGLARHETARDSTENARCHEFTVAPPPQMRSAARVRDMSTAPLLKASTARTQPRGITADTFRRQKQSGNLNAADCASSDRTPRKTAAWHGVGA